jgi:hypothetical protein
MPTEYVFDNPPDDGGAAGPVEPAAPAEPTAPALRDTVLGPEGQPEDKPGGEAGAKPEAALDTKPEAPDGYTLNFAEGIEVDTALLGTFQATAHEMGLTVGQSQKLADLYAGHTAEQARSFQEAQYKALNDYITARNAELARRPDFQAELTLAKKTLREFGSPELAEALAQTAMGSHPALFDFMAKVGKALGEPEMRGGPGGPEGAVPLQDRLWPGMK